VVDGLRTHPIRLYMSFLRRRCASSELFTRLASFQSCALTTARRVESYLRKARERQSGVSALALKMAVENRSPNVAAFVRSTKVHILQCDRHVFDRDSGIVLGVCPHLLIAGRDP
jgi:hypothetical protein